jgi:hypothetical protein
MVWAQEIDLEIVKIIDTNEYQVEYNVAHIGKCFSRFYSIFNMRFL